MRELFIPFGSSLSGKVSSSIYRRLFLSFSLYFNIYVCLFFSTCFFFLLLLSHRSKNTQTEPQSPVFTIDVLHFDSQLIAFLHENICEFVKNETRQRREREENKKRARARLTIIVRNRSSLRLVNGNNKIYTLCFYWHGIFFFFPFRFVSLRCFQITVSCWTTHKTNRATQSAIDMYWREVWWWVCKCKTTIQ